MRAIILRWLFCLTLLTPSLYLTSADHGLVSRVNAATVPEWEPIVSAARKEGKVVVAIPLGEAYPKVIAAFQKAYPDIRAEPFSIHTRDFMARYRKEREASQILWDALIGGPDSDIYGAGHQGFWDPIRPNLALPEVLDNSKWRGGLDSAFSDKNKTFAFNYIRRTTEGFFINRDAISENVLRDADGLWDTKWQGKIGWHDPREVGAGVNAAANPGSNSIVLVNKAPHPNARKVFLNWLLSQNGQAAVVQAVQENSIRVDVPVPEPERVPPEGKNVINPQGEEMTSQRLFVNKIAREIFR